MNDNVSPDLAISLRYSIEAGVDAAVDAVRQLPHDQQIWGAREDVIAETSARAALTLLLREWCIQPAK